MIFLFFGALLLSCTSVLLYSRKADIAVCVSLGICAYFITYVIITALLFFFEVFSLYRVATLNFVLWLAFLGLLWFKNRNFEPLELSLDLRKSGISYLIILILTLTFSGSFGYFGMGQDQGVYQVEAINLMNGKNLWHDIIEEYDDIRDDEYREFYEESIKSLLGFNVLSDEYRGLLGMEDTGELEGFYHGIPTFAAVLALSGKLFGLENLMLFQTVFYVISLLLLEFILKRQNISWWMRGILLLVFGISPEVVWISKSSLTEGFMATLLLLYFLLIFSGEYRVSRLSVVPILTFCLWHLSAFSIMPIFVVNYLYLYFSRKDKRYIRLIVFSLVGLLAALLLEYRVAPTYFAGNINKLFWNVGIFLPMNTILLLCVGSVVVAIITCELCRFIKWDTKRGLLIFENIGLVLMSVLIISEFITGRPYWGNGNFPRLMGASTIVAYITLSGFALLPLCIVHPILAIKSEKSDNYFIIANFMAWTVLFYSMFLRLRVLSYYYNSRYIMPYIAVILIMFGIISTKRIFENKILQRVVAVYQILGPLAGICIMLPFSTVIRNNHDDTNMQWSTLENVMNCISEDDVVYMDMDEAWLFYYPLRAKGARVYPVMENIDKTIEIINPSENSEVTIYYLTQSQIYEDDWQYEVKYMETSAFQLDNMGSIARVIYWPKEFLQKGTKTHVLYRILTGNASLDASSGFFGGGWSSNSSGYRWINAESATINVNLRQADYEMEIILGDRIPFELLAIEQVEIELYINNNFIDRLIINENTNGISAIIPKEVLNDGHNIVTFIAEDSWSPAEYGSTDDSIYVFSVDKIVFRNL